MKSRWRSFFVIALLVSTGGVNEAASQAAARASAFAQLYRTGQSAMSAGRYSDARAAFAQLEQMDASVAEVHASLGILNFKLGDFAHAIEEIRTARKLKPGLPGLDALLALSLAESGETREALPGLEKAFHSNPDPQVKRQAGLELARAYSQLSKDRQAVEVALEMRDLYKDDPEVLYTVGKILGNSAYLTMQDLFHGSTGSMWEQLAKGEAFESQRQFTDAILNYRKVLEADPRRINVHYRLGRTYLAQWETSHSAEDIAAAEVEFAKEIEIDPENANAAYELAGLRRNHGDEASARRLYESAIRSYPDFEEAEVGLAGILIDELEPSQAVGHLQRATALRADDEVAWYRLAQAERMIGDAPAQRQALAVFQKLHDESAAKRNKILFLQSQDSVTPQNLGVEAQPE